MPPSAPSTPAQSATTLEDTAHVTDLVNRLAACLDDHRFDDLAALFVEDATASTPGGTAHGRADVVTQATRNHVGFTRLQHLVTGIIVDLDGDEAAVRANLVGVFVRDGSTPEFVLGAVYRFRAVRTAAGWALRALEVTPRWRTPASA